MNTQALTKSTATSLLAVVALAAGMALPSFASADQYRGRYQLTLSQASSDLGSKTTVGPRGREL